MRSLRFRQSKLIQRADVVDVKFFVDFFSASREGNDRQTVDGNNSMKSKTTFVGEHTTYLTLNECVDTYVLILLNEK